ncbi:unnamed protein product [Arctia plantaginis]|uniref:Uncharacterized protein n=1 Tax=Arctia plantaginis TaxID=874455 RepID=A0A8S0ZYT0_ARCPL|nr:unnamed protein product [Arctia plantaginis]
MWRTGLLFSVILYTIVSNVTTAPTYNYYSRGPSYLVNNVPEVTARPKQPFLEVRNATYHGSGPREEARAMCSVKTQEVNATANATITRRLHGVVTSRELHSSIQRLEVIIYGQMQQLWKSLDALRVQLVDGRSARAAVAKVQYPDRHSVSFNLPSRRMNRDYH